MVGDIGGCNALEPIRGLEEIIKVNEAIQELGIITDPEQPTETISEIVVINVT